MEALAFYKTTKKRPTEGEGNQRSSINLVPVKFMFSYGSGLISTLFSLRLHEGMYYTSCGSCGFCIQVCCVRGTLVRKIHGFVASRKPANKLCGKRGGLAAGRERARLQVELYFLGLREYINMHLPEVLF